MTDRALGVCYYPEHWHPEMWREDAARMAALGLRFVRIGEFAWARMEPEEGRYDWGWLDDAIATLGAAGLKVVLCTPTPTPPKWLTDRYPQVLRHAEDGLPMKHGSRRHVSVASATYRRLSARITAALAERYGDNPHVAGWQTDNEFGCHFSTLSWGPEDREAFQLWLARRYGTIEALNEAWGNAFWSQTYRSFGEIDLPNRLQADPNPAHWLDFRRFFSDMTVEFNRAQVQIIRAASPGRFITHNAMMAETGFDHWALSDDLDFLSWDSYPLGFLRRLHEVDPSRCTPEEVARYQHIGHPDILAFHHDAYRSMSGDAFWVMEQQPGPVNWASQNPAPVDGAVRHWTLEAMAHGAQVVSYFRFRQAPWAQEQMHTGLFTPWGEPDQAVADIDGLAAELPRLPLGAASRDGAHTLGLVLDYEAVWAFEAIRQGEGLDPLLWTFDWYRAARQLGWNVEFIDPRRFDAERLGQLRLVVVPSSPILRPALLDGLLEASRARIVFGPRSGSRNEHLAFDALPTTGGPRRPLGPPPYIASSRGPVFAGLTVQRVESLPPETALTVTDRTNRPIRATGWVEHLRADGEGLAVAGRFVPPAERRAGLDVAMVEAGRCTYLGFQPDLAGMKHLLGQWGQAEGMEIADLGPDLRRRRMARGELWFNFGPEPATLPDGSTLAPRATRLVAR
ncbi:MAG: beta-galactosidase [Alphaproteobacteria bacterium]|nr:MAG: beta-galactosidase [Alphaproteobacteria bacterium]